MSGLRNCQVKRRQNGSGASAGTPGNIRRSPEVNGRVLMRLAVPRAEGTPPAPPMPTASWVTADSSRSATTRSRRTETGRIPQRATRTPGTPRTPPRRSAAGPHRRTDGRPPPGTSRSVRARSAAGRFPRERAACTRPTAGPRRRQMRRACQGTINSISQALRARRPATWQMLRRARAAGSAVRAYRTCVGTAGA